MPPNATDTAPATVKPKSDDPEDFSEKDIGALIEAAVAKAGVKRDADFKQQVENQAKDVVAAFQKEWAADFAKRYPSYSVPGTERTGDPKKDFSIARFVASIKMHDEKVAPVEWEMHRAAKAMQTNNDTSAGLLIPSQVEDEIIRPLRDKSVARMLGVRFITTKGFISIRKRRLVTDLVAQWVAENAPATKSDLKYTHMELRPRALRAITDVTNLMLEQVQELAQSEIMQSSQAQFELGGDRAILIGSGNGNEPLGIANTPGVGTASLAGPTYDQLLDFVGVVRVAKALNGQASWVMSPEKFNAIQKMRDADNAGSPPVVNQPLERRMLASGPIDTLVGFPFQWTGQLPPSGVNAAIFGIFAQAFWLQFGGMRVRVSDAGDTNMLNDTTTVAIVMYADVGVDQPKAFVVASA